MATVPNKDGFGGTDAHIDEPYGGTPIWGFTWNNPAVTWYGHRINITDTGSAADSKAIEVKRNGSSIFSVAKTGIITALGLDVYDQTASTGSTLVTVRAGASQTTGQPIMRLRRADGATTGQMSFSAFGAFVGATIANENSNGTFWGANGFMMSSTGALSWRSSTISENTFNGTEDLFLRRDAANTLAQRNGATAQTLRVYNTYTDGSNYEYGVVGWSSNNFLISTATAGTGTLRDIRMGFGANYFQAGAGGSNSVVGFLNTSNIGVGGSVSSSAFIRVIAGTTAAAQIRLVNGVAPSSPVDGDIWFDGTDLKMRIGGVTKTFTLT